jgi:hypothetical protein
MPPLCHRAAVGLWCPVNIVEAQGLADLERWEDVWEALEELPPEDRTAPSAIRLRLDCALGLERWETAKDLANNLAKGSDEDRVAAADAFRTLALVATRRRMIEAAKVLVRSAVEAWPGIRLAISDDPELSEHLD